MEIDTKTLNKKIELIQWISSLDDKVIIEKLFQFRKTKIKDWWDNIEDQEKESIHQGIEDAENNKLNPHSSARKLYEKWL